MTGRAPLDRPSGMAPPSEAILPDGQAVDLAPLAREVTELHLTRHPEDKERYGADLAEAWCRHDTQHILGWAMSDLDLDGQLAWLARVLDARDYPVRNLIDSVSVCAEVVDRRVSGPDGTQVAERLRAAARRLEAAPG